MRGLRIALWISWIVILVITWRAVAELGVAGGNVFISDLSHPWRAQFNADFSFHLLLFAIWVFWRETSKVAGAVCALLCVLGGLFTFLYLLTAIARSGGDARALVLGAHA